MSRMKTFCTYALIIILFFFYSNLAINLLIKNSYKPVSSDKIAMPASYNGFEINIDRAESNNLQGYFTGTVKNNSDKVIDHQYVKVESYHKGKKMQEKYLAFENMKPGEERRFKLRYSVGKIDGFKVSYVDEIPINETKVDKAIRAGKGLFYQSYFKVKKDGFFGPNGLFSSSDGGLFNSENGLVATLRNGIFGDDDGSGNGAGSSAWNKFWSYFHPVHVEGEDWQLFIAVMIVLYYMPSFWFLP